MEFLRIIKFGHSEKFQLPTPAYFSVIEVHVLFVIPPFMNIELKYVIKILQKTKTSDFLFGLPGFWEWRSEEELV